MALYVHEKSHHHYGYMQCCVLYSKKMLCAIFLFVLIAASLAHAEFHVADKQTDTDADILVLGDVEQRSKRVSPAFVLGANVILKGQKAAKQLLEGADHVTTQGRIQTKNRNFVKNGNINDAYADFMAVKPVGIRSFRQSDGGYSGKVGQVGDRMLRLIERNQNGKPTIEITKIGLRASDRSTDTITYTDYFPWKNKMFID